MLEIKLLFLFVLKKTIFFLGNELFLTMSLSIKNICDMLALFY
jgi:hypothetical protein